MKRYHPFALLEDKSPLISSDSVQLANHPNGFFSEEDFNFIKKSVRSLERIAVRIQAPDCPADVLLRNQLDELRVELSLEQENKSTTSNSF